MDKGLRKYRKKTTTKLKNWQHALKNASPDQREHLVKIIESAQAYHLIKVLDFQHERLVHLLVTLFFGFLFLFSVSALFAIQSLGLQDSQTLTYLAGALSGILLLTELMYIRYYYVLENGVQSLYILTDDFISLTSPSPLDAA